MTLRNVLFLAEGQLGDLLLLTPALRGMKAGHPGIRQSVLVLERRSRAPLDAEHPIAGPLAPNADSPLAGNPNVDRLFTLNRDAVRSLPLTARLRAELAIVRFVRAGRYDAVVCTFPEDRFAIWAFLSGAATRVGQRKQGLRMLLSVQPDIRKADSGVRSYYCSLVRACGAPCATDRTEYVVSGEARSWAGEALAGAGVPSGGRVVLLHPGATGDYKIWPPERWAELMDMLEELPLTVILCAGPLDEGIVGSIREHATRAPRIVDTGGKIGRLAAMMERSALCITNDSGPRHLAVAVGAPSLAFFRLHHDREWRVYDEGDRCATLRGTSACPQCPADRCSDRLPEGERFGSHCIRLISVEDAFAAAKKMLS